LTLLYSIPPTTIKRLLTCIMDDFDSKFSRCNFCKCLGGNKPLSRCGGCQVVRYCDQDHQSSDWRNQKAICKQIQKAKSLMDKEEAKLRDTNGPPHPWGWDNPFEKGVGHFWGMQ
jgi:MYND finger